MRCLITGASGFVGANLVRRLLRDGCDVHLLLRAEHNPWRIAGIADQCTVHIADLAQSEDVHRAVVLARPAWVFHAAAMGAYSWQTNLAAMIESNITGTANLLAASEAAGAQSFVSLGSSSEYGIKAHAPKEDECPEPNSHYAVTKLTATHLCRLHAMQGSMQTTVLRLYSVYGPFEDPHRLVPTLLLRAMDDQLPPLANAATARDYVYVDNVTEACLAAARRQRGGAGAVFNIGTGIQTSLREIVELVRQQHGVQESPAWGSMADRQWDTQTWHADPTAAARELGWRATTTLSDGLRNMHTWFNTDATMQAYYRRERGMPPR